MCIVYSAYICVYITYTHTHLQHTCTNILYIHIHLLKDKTTVAFRVINNPNNRSAFAIIIIIINIISITGSSTVCALLYLATSEMLNQMKISKICAAVFILWYLPFKCMVNIYPTSSSCMPVVS